MGFWGALSESLNNPEITRVKQQAKDLGIYRIIRYIATEGSMDDKSSEAEWEGCTIKFRVIEPSKIASSSTSSDGYFSAVAAAVASVSGIHATSISMPDGTILYRSEGDSADDQTVTDFRFGKWVERITAYSNELTAKREQEKQDKLAKEKEELLKPFSDINF